MVSTQKGNVRQKKRELEKVLLDTNIFLAYMAVHGHEHYDATTSISLTSDSVRWTMIPPHTNVQHLCVI